MNKNWIIPYVACSFIAFSSIAGADDALRLDNPDYVLPDGTAITSTIESESKNIKLRYEARGETASGIGSNKQSEVSVDRKVNAVTREILITKSSLESRMTMNGKESTPQSKANPLLNVKITASKIDGAWKFSAPSVENLTDEQKHELMKAEKEAKAGNWHYSTESRSVGETWKGGEDLMKSLSGLDLNLDGEVLITFSKLVEMQNQQCAVLDIEFDISGKSDEGYLMKMKGKQRTVRSLTHFIDLEQKLDATSKMSGVRDGVSVTMETPLQLSKSAVVTITQADSTKQSSKEAQ